MVNHVSAGKAYVDMSTVDAQTAAEIEKAISEKGARFLEAPVSGSKKPAEDGTVRSSYPSTGAHYKARQLRSYKATQPLIWSAQMTPIRPLFNQIS